MAIRTILHYPDKRLRNPGKTIDAVTPAIQALVDDMAETMYAAPGVGLAATQIGEPYQLFVIDVAEQDAPSDLRVFINPEILERHDAITWTEGCLSFPGITEDVDRAARVRVRALDRDGQPYEFDAEGLAAVCVQHEMDHLMGKVFVDYLSPLKRDRIKTKMLKKTRDEQKH